MGENESNPAHSVPFNNTKLMKISSEGAFERGFKKDIGLAAGILRLHFHDCFVQGCDGSVLLEKADREEDNERDAKENESLRPTALKAINDIHAIIDSACRPSLVSCADILALATRDSVALALIEVVEERQKPEVSVNGDDGIRSLEQFEKDHVAETFGDDKMRSYCRASWRKFCHLA